VPSFDLFFDDTKYRNISISWVKTFLKKERVNSFETPKTACPKTQTDVQAHFSLN